jgi:diphthamide biosynthesis protein 2
VGKLTPSKLANFLEIECYVVVACPENSLIEAKEFFKPIITPFELEIALKQDVSWTGRYVLDFDRVIAEGKANDGDEHGEGDEGNSSVESEERDLDQPQFSLISGKYRYARRYGAESDPAQLNSKLDSDSLVLRNQDTSVSKLDDSAAGMSDHNFWMTVPTHIINSAISSTEGLQGSRSPPR